MVYFFYYYPVIRNKFQIPDQVNQGVVITAIKDNSPPQMVKEVAIKTSDTAGDGKTTATVLAQAIFNQGLKLMASGINPMALKIGINAFVLKPLTMIELSNIVRKILDKKIFERRQNERFKIKEKAIATIMPDPEKEFEIVDISWGGIAICSDLTLDIQNQIDALSINVVNKGILLNKLPCKVVSDVTLVDELYQDIKKRQGLQFGKLGYIQLNMLDHVLHSCTIETN